VARDEDLAGLLRGTGWTLGQRIAHSPSSIVYRAARDGGTAGDGRAYALKVMREGQDPVAMLRAFRREAAMLAAVGHPGLPRMYEVDQAGEIPYLAMELLPGGSLADRLATGRLPLPAVLDLGREVAGTLAAAHHAGLVHRDVKPDNIVFDAAGRPRLIDFGLARGRAETEGEGVIGTLRYSSPEQSGMIKRPVDQRSDLYSLGAVLFECLTGEPPFTTPEVGELLRAHAVTVPPLVSERGATVPPALDALVAKLLAKDPDDRYHSGDGLAADLDRLLTGETDFALGSADDPLALRPEGDLVGRAGEFAALSDQWRRAKAGAGRLAMVRGRSGSGKTRLLRELARTVLDGAGVVLSGDCLPDSTPYGPYREAIERRLRHLKALGPAGEEGLAQVRAAAGEGAPLLGSLSAELAAVLGVPLSAEVEPELFAGAVANLVAGLARQCGGLLFCVNDVQWMDQASRVVTRRLAGDLGQVPLLVACTMRSEDDETAGLERFKAAGGTLGADLLLPELNDEAVGELLAAQLGGPLEDAFVGRLSGFIRGNPFAAIEFARALVNGGLISPHWGRSVVDERALAQVDVAGDVVELMTRLVDRLGPAADVLAAAAVIGERFELDLLCAVCPVPPEEVLAAVSAGGEARLVEPVGREEYAFVHHRVRELLLGRLDTDQRRAAHQRIATVLDRGLDETTERRRRYEVARHYAAGDLAEQPRRAFEAGWAAALAALADHAVAEAVVFVELAEQAAGVGGFVPDARFDATAGAVRLAAGSLAEAAERLGRALEGETDPRRRSALLEQLARVQYARPNYPAALRLAAEGLAELGRGIPLTWPAMVVTTLLALLKRCWIRVWPRRARGPATRERLKDYLRFAEITGRAAYQVLPRRNVLAMTPHFLQAADRYGPCPEYVHAYLASAMLVASVDRRRSAYALLARAEKAARQLGDPRLTARVEISRAHLQYFFGEPVAATDTLTKVLNHQIRWLPTEMSTEAIMALTVILDVRGHTRLSEQWRQRALELGLPSPTILFPSVVLGQTEEAEAQLAWVDGVIALDDAGPEQSPAAVIGETLWGGIAMVAVNVHLERGDLGPELDRAIEAYHRHGPTVRTVKRYWQRQFLMEAYARIAQIRLAADPAEQRRRLAQARDAVSDLGRVGEHEPVLCGHWRVAQAAIAQLLGRPEEALSRLQLADHAAEDHDAPWLRFESLVVRARVLQATGRAAAGVGAAELAVLLAERQGWVYRAARVRREFAVEGVLNSIEGRRTEGLTSTGNAGDLRDRRYLDALLQVSTAASSVLDPRQLARVALDELLKILGAERAYLFACTSDTAPLERYAGRDADGNDLDELVGYSSTVVERARAERRPLIVTGTDQGAAVGSQSAVAHGLRSIMVAPMQLEGRLLGVVYLDSRVAKGIFATEDEEVLVAIANQIGSSLETARAAQLEVQVEAERRQRGLADQLREATEELSRTLVPEEVLERALSRVADMVDADSGCVLLGDTSTLTVAATYLREGRAPGEGGAAVGEAIILPVSLAASAEMVLGGTGERLPEPLALVLGRPTNWMLVPLSARNVQFGMLALADRRAEPTSPRLAGIAAAFAPQAAIAYDNARLFRQVEQLATIDGLSNVFNRRHFMELAARELAAARRHDRPLAAIMLDIDHFKRVNDTYGHATGDQVIRVVAERLTGSIRTEDLLGRYGGEEFALLILDDETGATDLAERLRRAVEIEPVPTEDGPVPVTISVGVSTRTAADTGPDSIFARADGALYRAKQNGRNQVALAAAH
jgi:eukaryotic-like serine/threonine-protein kinase